MTKFVSGGKTHDDIKRNATNWTGILNTFSYNLCGKKHSWQAAGTSQAGGVAFLKGLYLLWVTGYLHAGSVPCSKELTTLLFANTGFTQVVLKREEVGQAEL